MRCDCLCFPEHSVSCSSSALNPNANANDAFAESAFCDCSNAEVIACSNRKTPLAQQWRQQGDLQRAELSLLPAGSHCIRKGSRQGTEAAHKSLEDQRPKLTSRPGCCTIMAKAVGSSVSASHSAFFAAMEGPGSAAYEGRSWASVKTATAVQMKQRQPVLRVQCVHISSSANSTPPMGAPKAACITINILLHRKQHTSTGYSKGSLHCNEQLTPAQTPHLQGKLQRQPALK